MAFYIELIKTEKEDQNFVHYVYQFSRTGDVYINAKGKTRYKSILVSGKLILNKRNGHIDILELAEGDNGMYVQRASSALVKHWKKGEFPEKTCWAS